MACKVKTHKKSRYLIFRLFWKGFRFWEGTKLEDTPENRKLAEAKAVIISQEMKDGTFDYIRHFPAGNQAPPLHTRETDGRPSSFVSLKQMSARRLAISDVWFP